MKFKFGGDIYPGRQCIVEKRKELGQHTASTDTQSRPQRIIQTVVNAYSGFCTQVQILYETNEKRWRTLLLREEPFTAHSGPQNQTVHNFFHFSSV